MLLIMFSKYIYILRLPRAGHGGLGPLGHRAQRVAVRRVHLLRPRPEDLSGLGKLLSKSI